MRTHLSCLLAGVIASAIPAQVGKPMPGLEVDASYNFDVMKLKNIAQLRGSAVLIDYWQTW